MSIYRYIKEITTESFMNRKDSKKAWTFKPFQYKTIVNFIFFLSVESNTQNSNKTWFVRIFIFRSKYNICVV